ncbi:DUF2971 domain-containing protein [Treponema vincentii]|jgi:hypothetical protein|uniref:DUF2971 domain-containing protein n=1 Tax=Treponema vincentii TaxID=69710 RepID=A0A6P1XZQ5_9SPIR|nr:DUF2971 domain-containing protein [Treponema vincentii]QHX42182.1 DUF2971 domain-containing protein [Treponema vincentii]
MFRSNDLKQVSTNKIYKYYSYDCDEEKMFAPFLKNTLRYRHPSSLNDPYDCYICKKNGGFYESIRKIEMRNVFVCSLTTSCDDILMWSHYATNHQGFVLEYDLEKLRTINECQLEDFSYVEYSDDVIEKTTRDFLSDTSSERKSLKAIFHKSKCWEYEKEIRSVLYGSLYSKNDYHDITLPDNSISAVILGSHFISKHKSIPKLLQNMYINNQLFYMQLQAGSYRLQKECGSLEEYFDSI